MSPAQLEQFNDLQDTVKVLQESHSTLQQEVTQLREQQKQHKAIISALEDRVNQHLNELNSWKETGDCVTPTAPHLTEALIEVSKLKARCDDAEGRSRRSNLLFFGMADTDKETWAQSEGLITGLCSKKLGIKIVSSGIERAHRLGAFDPQKSRPIIVKFSSFKEKEGILGSAHKLKGSRIAISEDFTLSVRLARRRLLDFARPKGTPFRLRHDKLIIDGKCFIFDDAIGSVAERCT